MSIRLLNISDHLLSLDTPKLKHSYQGLNNSLGWNRNEDPGTQQLEYPTHIHPEVLTKEPDLVNKGAASS